MPVVVISRLWQMVRSHYTVPEVSILTRSSGKKLKFPPISLKWDRIAYQMCKVVCLDVFAGPSDRDVGNMNQNVLGVMIWCWVWIAEDYTALWKCRGTPRLARAKSIRKFQPKK